MLKRMIVHTLLAAVAVGTMAGAYQASARNAPVPAAVAGPDG